MTIKQFRTIALSMPEAVERAHMGHPDFRVKDKIFATLFTRDGVERGMVKLTLDQQSQFVAANPDMFQPVKGGWGKRGATEVCIKAAKQGVLRDAMMTAWMNVAPKKLIEEHTKAVDE